MQALQPRPQLGHVPGPRQLGEVLLDVDRDHRAQSPTGFSSWAWAAARRAMGTR